MFLLEQRCWSTSVPNPFLDPFMLESLPTSSPSSKSFTANVISTTSATNAYTLAAAYQLAPTNSFENSTLPTYIFNSEDQMWSSSGGGTYNASIAEDADSNHGTMNSMFVPQLPLEPMKPCSSTSTNCSSNQIVQTGAQISSGEG